MLTQHLINIRDQTAFGQVTHEFELSFSSTAISLQEIITQRVYKEVKDFESNKKNQRYSLVKPLEVERILNIELDHQVEKSSIVSFIKLIPLAGG